MKFYTYNKGLYFDYRLRSTLFKNEYFDNEEWRCDENWFAFCRFSKKLYEYEDWYYDGHTMKVLTILGVEMGLGYSYDSRRLSAWVDK